MLTDPGSWPTITHQHEVFAMLGADRMSAGLQVLRDRPGYSTSVFQADDASEADRKAVRSVWRPLVGWHATMSVRPEHAREIGETLWRVSMKQSGLLVEAE
jgi:hypothetical protein